MKKLISISLFFLVIFIAIYKICSVYFLNSMTSLFAIIVLGFLFLVLSSKTNKINRKWKYYALIPVYLLVCYLYANFKYSLIIESQNSGNDIIKMTDGNDYKTSKSLRFIGQTKSHIFLFNKDNRKTFILKWSNVDSMQINLN